MVVDGNLLFRVLYAARRICRDRLAEAPSGFKSVKETIGAHYTAVWPVVGSVHVDTIYTTWLVMAVVLALLAWVGQSYRRPRVGKTQTIFEGVIEYIADLVYGSLGKSGEPFVPFFV